MADPTPPSTPRPGDDNGNGDGPPAPSDGGPSRATSTSPWRRAAPLLVVLVAVVLLVVVAITSPFETTAPAIEVREAYVGASSDPAGAYLVIVNRGGTDDLTAVQTDLGHVTLQRRTPDETSELEVLREVDSLRLAGYEETRLQPGDDQLLIEVAGEPPAPGTTATLRLEFRLSDPLTVEAEVLSYDDIGQRMLPPLLQPAEP